MASRDLQGHSDLICVIRSTRMPLGIVKDLSNFKGDGRCPVAATRSPVLAPETARFDNQLAAIRPGWLPTTMSWRLKNHDKSARRSWPNRGNVRINK